MIQQSWSKVHVVEMPVEFVVAASRASLAAVITGASLLHFHSSPRGRCKNVFYSTATFMAIKDFEFFHLILEVEINFQLALARVTLPFRKAAGYWRLLLLLLLVSTE